MEAKENKDRNVNENVPIKDNFIHPREMKAYVLIDTCAMNVTAALFEIVRLEPIQRTSR